MGSEHGVRARGQSTGSEILILDHGVGARAQSMGSDTLILDTLILDHGVRHP